MEYAENIECLRTLYQQREILDSFDQDNSYLENAFECIEQLWQLNFEQIDKVKYLMLAEAPPWGKDDKIYIYNPDSKNTGFLYPGHLKHVLKHPIRDKSKFIECCNKLGLLVLDILPFALNGIDTKINYRELSVKQYRDLVNCTVPTYFEKKVESIKEKISDDIKIFYRYCFKKQMTNFTKGSIAEVFIDKKFIQNESEIVCISNQTGGIDTDKLRGILGGGDVL